MNDFFLHTNTGDYLKVDNYGQRQCERYRQRQEQRHTGKSCPSFNTSTIYFLTNQEKFSNREKKENKILI